MKGYTAKVVDTNRELSVKERIAIKDVSDALSLDEAVGVGEPLIVDIDVIANIAVHNEMSDNPDYNVYVITDKNGEKFKTSSDSCWYALNDIIDELSDEGISDGYSIKFYKKESKNYKGKYFITCAVV